MRKYQGSFTLFLPLFYSHRSTPPSTAALPPCTVVCACGWAGPVFCHSSCCAWARTFCHTPFCHTHRAKGENPGGPEGARGVDRLACPEPHGPGHHPGGPREARGMGGVLRHSARCGVDHGTEGRIMEVEVDHGRPIPVWDQSRVSMNEPAMGLG